MSDVNVISRTQRIVVNPISRAVSIINAGPMGPTGVGDPTVEPRVTDLETTQATQDADIAANTADIAALDSDKVNKAGDTLTGILNAPSGMFQIGDITFTKTDQSGTKHLQIDGVFHDFHPVVFRAAHTHLHDGTLLGGPQAALTNGVPRVQLAKPGTKTIKWIEEIPAGWDNVTISFDWTKEAAGSGNVHWRISYQVLAFLGAHDLDNGAFTQVYNTNVAVPATQGNGLYTITSAPFATAPQFFGIPPLICVALQRIDDAGDTFAGAVSVAFTSNSFT